MIIKKNNKDVLNKRVVKKGNNLLILVVVVLVSIFIGMLTGALCMYTYGVKNGGYEKIENITSIEDAYNKIINEYYGEVSEEDLTNAAIDGMTSILDSNTSYFDEGDTISFNNKLSGSFKGIGIEAGTVSEGVLIARTLDNSPAEEAGLMAGDIIISYNDISLEGKTAQYLTSAVANSEGEVKLTILRDGNKLDYNIVLNTVIVENVSSKVITKGNNKIGYIKISLFSLNSASQFKTELEKIEKEGISSLIIDVRDNTGGYLHQVTEILELLLKKDMKLYSIKTKTEETPTFDSTDEYRDYDIVVLTNEYSASASEILASSLKDNLGSVLVGKKTFGKGSAQETTNVSTGGMIKMTTKVWLRANGQCIDKIGIEPDYDVTLSDEYYNNAIDENDNQLQKAIEILNK